MIGLIELPDADKSEDSLDNEEEEEGTGIGVDFTVMEEDCFVEDSLDNEEEEEEGTGIGVDLLFTEEGSLGEEDRFANILTDGSFMQFSIGFFSITFSTLGLRGRTFE